MEPTDFVYLQIYKGSLAAGAKEKAARDQAIIGLDKYKKSNFRKKVTDLISHHITQAKKMKG